MAGHGLRLCSIPHYQDVRDRTGEIFERVAAWNFVPRLAVGRETTERLVGMTVSANFFQTYGVIPHLGRAFIPGVEDEGPGVPRCGSPGALLLADSLRRATPQVIGPTLTLNGHPFEVVGVAAPRTSKDR